MRKKLYLCCFFAFLLQHTTLPPLPLSPIDTTTNQHPLKNNQTFFPPQLFFALHVSPFSPHFAKKIHFPCESCFCLTKNV